MMAPIRYNGDVLNHNARVGVDGGIVESTDFLADFSEQTKRVNMPLLLDIYPNAAAAYSLRKLRTAYTGSAIRVRRSSDNTETDIGFNNAGDLDTSALMAFVGNGNGFVSTWYDQSGSGNNVIQTGTTAQPVVVSGGTIIVNNGRNSLRFDGLNDFLSINKSLFDTRDIALITIYSSLNTSAFQYIVGQGGDANTGAWGVGSSTNTFGIYYGFIQTSFGRLAFAGAGTDSVNGSTKVFTQLFLRNSNRLAYVNNNLIATTDISAYNQTLSGSTDPFYIGTYAKANQGFFNGHLNEVLIYNSNQSPNRIGIETNINSYYRIYQQEALLLDYYPDAAAAYSLRKLRSGYTGAAIQVRRSSDSAVQNIGFDSNGGLDTTALTTFVGTGNTGFVTTWYDQSLNGNNVTQTGTTAQPVIFSGGTVLTQNSRPSISFDGVNDFLTGGDILRLNNFNTFATFNIRNNTNAIQVVQTKGLGGNYVGSWYSPVIMQNGDVRTVRALSTSSEAVANTPNKINLNLLSLHVGSYNNVNLTSRLNNSSIASTSASGDIAFSTDSYIIGKFAQPNNSLFFLSGSVSEIINYGFKQETSVENNIAFNINSYYNIYPTDSDANAFVTAAALTGTTQIQAVNKLVTDLKGYGLWGKMKAIYPFVGGTAASHKFNLKDPRDVDGAFRLVFNGGWTHSATGALPNGTTGWANTYFNPSSVLTVDSTHMSIYSNTNDAVLAGSTDPVDMGSYNSATQSITLVNSVLTAITRNLGAVINWTQSTRLGLVVTNKTASNITKIHKNGVVVASGSSVGTLPTLPIFIGTLNYLGTPYNIGYTNNRFAFATIGDGLTDTEAANLYTAVQAFQTTLGRQV